MSKIASLAIRASRCCGLTSNSECLRSTKGKFLFLRELPRVAVVLFQDESVKTEPIVADFSGGLCGPDPKNEQYHDIAGR